MTSDFFVAAVQQAALSGGDRGRGEGGHRLRQHGRQAGQSKRHQQHVSRTQEVGTTRTYKMFFVCQIKNTGNFLKFYGIILSLSLSLAVLYS